MILKGRSRGHASQLARYLFHEKNDAIKVLDIRGTCAQELTRAGLIDAMKEFDEYGKLTSGQKTVFHLAIAPSDFDRMDSGKWQYAIGKAEEALGLDGQPRAVVMHRFEGKEHIHVAWSRVDLETHTLKNDSFTNLKLCNAARDIELDLGLLKLPDIHRGHERARQLTAELTGEQNQQQRKPKEREKEIQRFTEEEGHHSKNELKRAIASAWHQSGSGEEFRELLTRQGYELVRGDRGAVVMDAERNVYSPARYIEGVKVKEINAKCADVLDELQSVDQARHHGGKAVLTPNKAKKMTRAKLRLEFANDPTQPPRMVMETEEFEP
jgi:hypothetical protein